MSTTTTAMMSLDLAREYLRRGWAIVPVPHQTKAPRITGWQKLRIGEDDLPAHFNGQPMNVGILLGEPSAWLVDVDLDHEQAVTLAHDYLPPTEARFGRDGKPDSHWLYRVRGPIDTTKYQTEGRVMLVELRATGCQTIGPGSTHTSGERIRWDAEGEPAEVDADELAEAVAQLARDTADTIGEPLKVKPKRKAQQTATTTGNVERAWRYIVKLPDAIAGQGGHDATFRAACEAYRFGLSDAEAWQLLQRFNAEKCEPAWTETELRHKLDDARARVHADGEVGMRLADQARPHQPAKGAAATMQPGRDAALTGDLEARAKLCTDIGNGARFALQHADKLRWCGAWQAWLRWARQRWQRDDSEAVIGMAKATAMNIAREALGAEDEAREKVLQHAAKSQRRDRLTAMVALARDDMAVTPDELDADPFAFNVANGTLHLRGRAELRPHDPSDHITKLAPVEYHPDAEAPRFMAFLDRIFNGDAELIAFIQRWLGYCMTGDTTEQIMPVLHGVGANGKSTLLDTVAWLMGDYAGQTSADLFVESRTGVNEQRYELAELHGKRLVIATESERDRRLRVALVKSLTGDDQVKARPIYGRPFAYARTFKPLLVTNHRPRVDEDSEAVWRRLRLVPFNVVVPKDERDPKLPAKLRAEGPGILRWLVQGCEAWQRDGLGEPEAVSAATSDYRAESDPLRDFLADCCTLHPEAWCKAADLRAAYEAFCRERGEKPEGGATFTESLRRHGGEPQRKYAGRGWAGIGLIAGWEGGAHDGA